MPSSTFAERSRSEASLFADKPAARSSASESRVQRLRGQRVADGGAHPPVDRLSGAAGELLEDDRAHEGGERPVRVARPVADRADAGDEVGENGVARSDLVDRRPERALCR